MRKVDPTSGRFIRQDLFTQELASARVFAVQYSWNVGTENHTLVLTESELDTGIGPISVIDFRHRSGNSKLATYEGHSYQLRNNIRYEMEFVINERESLHLICSNK